MKLGTLDLTKFKRLQRRLNETVRGTVGLLELIWIRAAKDCPQGDIGRLSNLEIAIMAEWDGDADELVDALTDCGWFDPSESSRLLIHDWPDHVPNWLKGVVAKKFGGFLLYGSKPTVRNHGSPTMVGEPCLTKSSHAMPFLPHPQTPAPRDSGDFDLEPTQAGWEAVAAELAAEGVRLPEKACDSARSRGVLPHEVRAVLEYWRENKPAWNAGALYYKVLGMRPEEKHQIRWPERSAEFVKAVQKKTAVIVANKREETKAKWRKEQAEAESKSASLETEYGPELDAMSTEKLREFVAANLPLRLGQLPDNGAVVGSLRGELLRAIASVPKAPNMKFEVTSC